jgi:hypothetical protein
MPDYPSTEPAEPGMREAPQFRLGEWLRFVPVVQGLKQRRNDLLLARYLRTPAAEGEAFLRRQRGLAGKRIAMVIAFEQPWALDWHLRMAARNLEDTQVLVFDNSRTEAPRRAIREVCGRHGTPYLGLPTYRTRHVNRSHGMAMSWVYHNVAVPLAPESFGYLDHDLIPVAPVDLAQQLRTQPAYGMLNAGNFAHWNLWAGYCFYRHDFTAGKPLNFLYDFSRGLDTGGRNWNPLYRGLDRAGIRFAPQEFVTVHPPGQAEPRKVEIVDRAWVHVGGVSYNDNFERKHAFFESLKHAFDDGARWQDLIKA